MTQVEGGGGGEFGYRVAYPSQATDDTYEVTLETYNWNNGRDVSPSTISGTGYAITGDPLITLEFHVDLVSPDYNYADGVLLIYTEEEEILGAKENTYTEVSCVYGKGAVSYTHIRASETREEIGSTLDL